MTDIVLLSKDELAAMIDRRLEIAFNIRDPKAQIRRENKAAKEIAKMSKDVVLLKKQISELQFAISHMLTPQISSLTSEVIKLRKKIEDTHSMRPQQDTICKADVPQDVIKKPRTGTATTSDGIYFKDVNPDR